MIKKLFSIEKLPSILRDFVTAADMRFSMDVSRRARGKELAIDACRRLLAWLIVPFACLFAPMCVLLALMPPYGTTNLTLLLVCGGFIWLAFPVPLKVRDSWTMVLLRFGAIFLLLIEMTFWMHVHFDELESTHTPEQRRDRQERFEDAERRRKEQSDARLENRAQREFYDQLGAPKLLYRCTDSSFETAIGAEFGTLNRLIREAKARCRESGVEIVKRKE